MALNSDRFGSSHHTDASPTYPLFGRRTSVSIGIAAGLITATLVLLWVARDTLLAEWTVYLYTRAPLAPLTGLVVFTVLLTGGRYVGLVAAVREQIWLAFAASLVLAVSYAAFGAGVLSLYAPSIQGPAVYVTTAITTVITVGAAVVVYTTDHSFAHWDYYSGLLMLGGGLCVALFTGLPSAMLNWLGFGLILLGWIVDLVFEIYMVSNDERSAVANGIGVYVAFMGVFVHILQLVLEAMAED